MDNKQQEIQALSGLNNTYSFGTRRKLTAGVINWSQFTQVHQKFHHNERFSYKLSPGSDFECISSEKGPTIIYPKIEDRSNGNFTAQGEQLLILQGMLMKMSLAYMGNILSSCIDMTGQWLSAKVEREQFQVDSETRYKYIAIRGQASEALDKTTNVLCQVLQPICQKTEQMSTNLGERIDQSDRNSLKSAKALTSAAWDAWIIAFSGFGTGVVQVCKSLGKQTKILFQKKYGSEFVETYLGNPISETEPEVKQQ